MDINTLTDELRSRKLEAKSAKQAALAYILEGRIRLAKEAATDYHRAKCIIAQLEAEIFNKNLKALEQ